MVREKHEKVDWFDMPEEDYRSSRVLRALGSPKAFSLIKLLLQNEQMTVEDLAARLNRSQWDTSKILRSLRDLDLVRYQKSGRWTLYTLKNRPGMHRVLDATAEYVKQVIETK